MIAQVTDARHIDKSPFGSDSMMVPKEKLTLKTNFGDLYLNR